MDRDDLLEMFVGLDLEEGSFTRQICGVCARVLDLTGAGITLHWAGEHRGSLGSTAGIAEIGEELQFSLGEGPAVDASVGRVPIEAADLHTERRWMAFAPQAVEAGIAATFAVPLSVGAPVIGALTAYSTEPSPLTGGQRSDLSRLGDVVTQLVLAIQAGAPPGALAAALADVGSYHPEVHQATGMVSVQLGVPVPEAMVRLRAAAYANERSLADFSNDVIARRVRMEDE